ncbi:hypothetical protein [uncultured Veillonella sp.]|uniref:hypothetical protein n=1 Tax=uncultured Veillonella sp. TaxID=159268 RepID=UPI00261361A0|nr:hypothetical protein [uncultured Veillonella sp.]
MVNGKHTVKVDIYEIEADQVEQYIAHRELCAKAAMDLIEPYCDLVKRETFDPKMGEGIVGYIGKEQIMSVLLDPFEVPVMKLALERGNLETYILAANGLTKDMAVQLKTNSIAVKE